MLEEQVAKRTQTEWAAPISFAPEKHRTLRLLVDNWKLNAVTKRGSNSIHAWMLASILSAEPQSFQHRTQIVGTGKEKSTS